MDRNYVATEHSCSTCKQAFGVHAHSRNEYERDRYNGSRNYGNEYERDRYNGSRNESRSPAPYYGRNYNREYERDKNNINSDRNNDINFYGSTSSYRYGKYNTNSYPVEEDYFEQKLVKRENGKVTTGSIMRKDRYPTIYKVNNRQVSERAFYEVFRGYL